MRKRSILVLAALWFVTGGAALVHAAPVTRTVGAFDITFYNKRDSDGSGTRGAQNWTTPQMDDVVASAATWANRITDTAGRQVKLHLFWYGFSGNTLGTTSAPTNGNGTHSWTYVEHVWRDGVDYTGPWTKSDGTFELDTNAAGTSWNFGTGAPASGQIDFRGVVAHEIGHALGFYPSYTSSDDTWGNCWGTATSPNNFAGTLGLANWDRLLVDSAGNHPANDGTGTPGNFNQAANPVWFTGAGAVAYYGGNVPIYAPNPYEGGSSLSHLDETRLPNALMSPFIAMGQTARRPTRLEWEMMKDLGWSVVTTIRWTKGAGTLNWADAANWDNPSGPPDDTWDVVLDGVGLAQGDVLNLGGNQSVNVMEIDSGAGFTLGGTSGTLTIVKGNLARTAASSGTQTIARPVAIGSKAVWDISGAGQLAVVGGISGAGFGIEKRGTGTLLVSGANTWSGPTLVGDGTLLLSGGSLASSSLTVSAGATLACTAPAFTYAASFSNSGAVRVQGGTLTLSGPVGQCAGTTLTGGTWEVDANSALAITTVPGIVTNRATVVLDGPNSLFAPFDALAGNEGRFAILGGRDFTTAADLANSGTLTVGDASTLKVNGILAIDAGVGGVVDLAGGSLIVDYAPGNSPLAQVAAWVRSGLTDGPAGYWDGPGIASSLAAADAGFLTAVGILDNSDAIVGGKTTFAGQAVDATSVHARCTWWGDVNLDGAVDANDYDIIDRNFLFQPLPDDAGWWTGDVDYDGKVNANDYDLVDRAFLLQGDPMSAVSMPAPAPEPATLALAALGGLRVLLRRRRP